MIAAIAPPPDLTLPRHGSTTARALLSRAIGRLPADLRDVLRAADARDVASLARAMNRDALSSVLRRPNVGALVRCLRNAPEPRLVAELIATLAVELAMLGALNAPVRLHHAPSTIVSLAGRFALHLPPLLPGEELTIDREGIEALGTLTRPFHPVAGEIVLALEDNNPLSMLEAHPKKAGNRIDLGGREPSEWCASLADALARIERYLPELRAEHDLYVHQFVPVGFDAEAHLSASYREAIGTIYLTLHPHAMTMTEAVIHEFSHNKLNALFEVDDVLHNAFAPLFKSPVRPDPRPLHGVLLAVHAFVPVARLYEAMLAADDPLSRSASFRARYAQIVAGNREGMLVLANADPTPAGRAVLDELAQWDRHFSTA